MANTAVTTRQRKARSDIPTMADAISGAIADEMARDSNIIVMGEDIALLGGTQGQTRGLLDRFGASRVRDTPISEAAFIGAACGAAVEGLRPIVELMRVDFFGVAMDQIANYMAKTRYLSGGRRALPVTLMTAIGNPLRQGALHAQTIYSIFAHFPGLKVVIPSTPYDAKGLMTSAIRSDDPVLYFYHSGLMGLSWGPGIEEYTAKELPADTYEIQLGRADIKKQGSDITVASVSLMVHEALRAAKSLAAEGIDVEVLDLRGLVPLDLETLEASLNRTRRLLVVDEDYLRFGMTAEIIACAIELVGNKLLTPPRRLARVQAPPPFSRVLEEYATPSAGKIVEAIRQMVNSA